MYRFSLAVLIFWAVLMAVWIVIPVFGDLETWFWLCVMWPFSALCGILVYLPWFNKWLKAEQQKYYPPKKE